MSTNENVLARQMLKSVLLTAFGDSITPAQADVALRAVRISSSHPSKQNSGMLTVSTVYVQVNVLVDSGVLQFSEDRLDPATLAALQKEFKVSQERLALIKKIALIQVYTAFAHGPTYLN